MERFTAPSASPESAIPRQSSEGSGDPARQGTTGPPTFFVARWLFLRLLGLVYLAAFLSLWVQIDGLIGRRGILPVANYLAAVRQAIGSERYYLLPTLCWLDVSPGWLCAGGVLFSCLVLVGLGPGPVLFLLWAFYLSLTVAGQIFLGYQWDALLLETGFLAIFFAPLQIWPRPTRAAPPPRVMLWLFRWLLFRLMFASGVVKLLSGDATWRHLTALRYHYETQPLPTWTSWYMYQLPAWFQTLSVLFTFVAELAAPVLLFGPRRVRYLACGVIAALQLLIAATGNYGFFNLLTLVLCVPVLDDHVFPARLRARLAPPREVAAAPATHRVRDWLLLPVAAGIFLLSIVSSLARAGLTAHWPRGLMRVYQAATAFQSVNTYGLFAIMTTQRPEIIVEGSDDGRTWLPYEFKWKPGDVYRRPAFTGLHMPRLDWQMWFAALGGYQDNPWFVNFLVRLFQGSPEALALLDHNPFPERPPRYLRAVLYDYHFTTLATRRESGAWWRREQLGLYSPVMTLGQGRDGSRRRSAEKDFPGPGPPR